MSHHPAFLDAIRDNPHDDTPRLIYADWLDENGDAAQATFIRAQVEAARLPLFDPRREQLEAEADALLTKHRKKWYSPLQGLTKTYEVRRGLLERASLPLNVFLDHFGEFRDTLPLWDVKILKPFDRFAELPNCRWLAELRSLDFIGTNIGAARATQLLNSPHLKGLRRLDLSACKINTAVLARLAQMADKMPNLRELGLRFNVVVGFPEDFFDSPLLEGLTRLELNQSGMFAADLKSLCSSRRLRAVEQLYLGESIRINKENLDYRLLFRSTALPRLRHLEFDLMTYWDEDTLREFPAASAFASLEFLHVPWMQGLLPIIDKWANSPAFPKLRVFQMQYPGELDQLKALLKSALWQRLEVVSFFVGGSLNVDYQRTLKGVLAKAPSAPRLRKILFYGSCDETALSPFADKFGEQMLRFSKNALLGIQAE